MTFWELADVADDHEPYSGVDVDFLSPAEVKRTCGEYETLRSVLSDRPKFEAAFPDVGVQPSPVEDFSLSPA